MASKFNFCHALESVANSTKKFSKICRVKKGSIEDYLLSKRYSNIKNTKEISIIDNGDYIFVCYAKEK